MTKEFFHIVRKKLVRNTIIKLQNSEGTHGTNHSAMEQICINFCHQLYAARPRDDSVLRAEEAILATLPTTLSPTAAQLLGQPLMEHEVYVAAIELAHDKAPGLDGVAVQFFIIYWDQISQDYCENTRCRGKRSLLSDITNGLITLLTKSGDQSMLSNWRPITLLNISYKIFTMCPFTDTLIH